MKLPLKIIFISFIVAAGFNIILFWYVIKPKKIAIKQKEADYLMLRDNLFEVRQRIKNEKYIKEKFSNIKNGLEKFDLVLPRHEEITRLIQELPVMAEKTGVKVSGVKYQPFIKDEGYNRLSFSMPVEGKYSNIRRFIYEIETMRKIIWIERLTIRTLYSTRDELSIQLTMSTYFL